MDIIISNKSALEYWRTHANVEIDAAARVRRKRQPASLPKTFEIHDKVPTGLSNPINIMVGSKTIRRKSTIYRPCVYTGPTPDWSFVSVGNGMAVSAPPFCFFQMAGVLPLVKLIQLGFELCGSYSLPIEDDYRPWAEDEETAEKPAEKTIYDHPRLTDTKALKAFVSRMEGVSGQKKASRALRYIADGSASPMETVLAMLLTLPYKLGGYGLPMPELNKRVENKKPVMRRRDKKYYVCDLLWPKENIAIEYDSESFHANFESMKADSDRRLDLVALGINPLNVTSRLVKDIVAFDYFAKTLARELGKRLRYKEPEFLKARRELRKILF